MRWEEGKAGTVQYILELAPRSQGSGAPRSVMESGSAVWVIRPHNRAVSKGQGCVYLFLPASCLSLVTFHPTGLYFPMHFWVVSPASFGQLLVEPDSTSRCEMFQVNPKLEGKAGAPGIGFGTGAPGAPMLTGTVEAVTKPSAMLREL